MQSISSLATGFTPQLETPFMQPRAMERSQSPSAASDSVSLSMPAPDEGTSRLMADAFSSMQGENPLTAHSGLSAERVMRLVGLLE